MYSGQQKSGDVEFHAAVAAGAAARQAEALALRARFDLCRASLRLESASDGRALRIFRRCGRLRRRARLLLRVRQRHLRRRWRQRGRRVLCDPRIGRGQRSLNRPAADHLHAAGLRARRSAKADVHDDARPLRGARHDARDHQQDGNGGRMRGKRNRGGLFQPARLALPALQNVADDGFHVSYLCTAPGASIATMPIDSTPPAFKPSNTLRKSWAFTPASMRRKTCLVWRDTSA